MSDTPPSSEPPPPPTEPTHGKVSEVIREGSRVARFLASMTPAQMQTLVLFILTVAICFGYGYQTYQIQRTQNEREGMSLRSSESREELLRRHCASESRELRTFFANQDERRIRAMADERGKDRELLERMVRDWAVMSSRWSDLERALRKMHPELSVWWLPDLPAPTITFQEWLRGGSLLSVPSSSHLQFPRDPDTRR